MLAAADDRVICHMVDILEHGLSDLFFLDFNAGNLGSILPGGDNLDDRCAVTGRDAVEIVYFRFAKKVTFSI